MAATTAKIGKGVLLKRGDGGGAEVFTAVAELKSLSGPSWNMDAVEATHTDSPSAFREYVAGLRAGGEITAECNFLNDATQNLAAGIRLDMVNGTLRNFQIVFPSATTCTVALKALVTGFAVKAAIGDVMTVEIKLMISGLPTES